MMNKFGRKIDVAFHEETHSYVEDIEFFENFKNEYEIAETDEEKADVLREYDIKKRRISSVTQLLGESYVFKYDDNLLVNWFTKTTKLEKYQNATPELLEHLKTIVEVLKQINSQTQIEGTITHIYIQEYIKSKVNGTKFDKDIEENFYTKKFELELMDENSNIKKLVDSIDELYDFEIPVGFETLDGKYRFAGMWDLLYKDVDGNIVILDIKTGSKLDGEKKQKVNQQLNAYNLLVRGYYEGMIIPNKHICLEISSSPKLNEETLVHEEKTKIALHNFEPNPQKFLNLIETNSKLKNLKKLK